MINKLLRIFHRPPDFKIGRGGDWYMLRWYVIPRNRWFNIYLHKVLRDDEPANILHDHPWWNMSVVLRGGYWEVLPSKPEGVSVLSMEPRLRDADWNRFVAQFMQRGFRRVWRRPGSVVLRRPTDAHRLELARETHGLHYFDVKTRTERHDLHPIPSWSLFITGPKLRGWGFWCESGWIPWDRYVKRTPDGNEIGAGCA